MSFRYLLFHKPMNVLSQFTAKTAKRTLADYIPVPGVYPVGRLDYDSEGLLLLTDDGVMQHRLSDPQFAHPRTYWVQVEGLINEGTLALLREGVTIQEYRTSPCEARSIPEPPIAHRNPPVRFRKNIPTSWLELKLTEGRNRQVRRMTATVGFPTLRLVRFAIGDLTIEGLSPGSWRGILRNELPRL